ncbi:hypothetical protein BDW02DRAFT_146705 [Decorospora gaudefroyi]|uniref:Uncharacterized protein n=1 Tax=Decorospora gaudefroyi TaxID=184978 RepID=A0A6A5JYR4_9PLEO|nr:hypothetical protein BDW02DRAFT_146705 [Decorospora gaudefroyi]
MTLWILATFAALLLHSRGVLAAVLATRADTSFGSCENPTIEYVQGQNGLPGFGYRPANLVNFPHGASPNIDAIAQFICSTLQNACMASSDVHSLCNKAGAEAKAKTANEAAVAFNQVIMQTPAVPSPSPSPSPLPSAQPNVTINFSHGTYHWFGDDNPKDWFDKYIKVNDGLPKVCDEEPQKLAKDYYITFECEGHDATSIPFMRKALNAAVDATIDNEDMKEEERIFMHYPDTEQVCSGGGPYPSCAYKKVVSTKVPQSVHIAVGAQIPGQGGFAQGYLRYSVSKSKGDNCKACSFFGSGMGAASALSGALSAQLGVLGGIVTIACLAAC